MKIYYVAMTRPKGLLCLVLLEEDVNEEEKTLLKVV